MEADRKYGEEQATLTFRYAKKGGENVVGTEDSKVSILRIVLTTLEGQRWEC